MSGSGRKEEKKECVLPMSRKEASSKRMTYAHAEEKKAEEEGRLFTDKDFGKAIHEASKKVRAEAAKRQDDYDACIGTIKQPKPEN